MKNILLMVAFVATAFIQKTSGQGVVCNAEQPIQDVITYYLRVKNSLTKDNGDSVRTAAKNLYSIIESVPMEKLGTAEYKVWMQYQKKLSSDAAHMGGTSELEHQREHFMKLSDNFYKMVKALNTNTTDLYYQFCPMANDGKGAYWVSEKQAIANPYFGKRMMTCGSTKETIKGKP
ncbi:MAG TPA: DUF3347 domain-containing protein [Saprospiraceae bacterium]|nr:DUF3347 domain-containing protein [Saprospiraceae bacterium]